MKNKVHFFLLLHIFLFPCIIFVRFRIFFCSWFPAKPKNNHKASFRTFEHSSRSKIGQAKFQSFVIFYFGPCLYVCNELIFDGLHFMYKRLLFEVCSPHLHASFVTLCIKIGQLFETQGIFEEYLKIDKYPLYKDYVADFEFFWMFKESLGLY